MSMCHKTLCEKKVSTSPVRVFISKHPIISPFIGVFANKKHCIGGVLTLFFFYGEFCSTSTLHEVFLHFTIETYFCLISITSLKLMKVYSNFVIELSLEKLTRQPACCLKCFVLLIRPKKLRKLLLRLFST